MKKLTLILLSLVLCVSLFACGESGESSSEASKDNSSSRAVSESESSANDESSKTLSEDSSESGSEPEYIIPEFDINKVLYYEGYYSSGIVAGVPEDPILDDPEPGIEESYSQGLADYLDNNEISEDTYFLVGLRYFPQSDEERSRVENLLSEVGFIEDVDNGFCFENNPYISDTDGYLTKEELLERLTNRFAISIPGVDISEYDPWAIELIPGFEKVGYLNVSAFDYLDENTEIVIDITWFPSPEENVRWLDSTKESNQS